jgi:hypothetical protein
MGRRTGLGGCGKISLTPGFDPRTFDALTFITEYKQDAAVSCMLRAHSGADMSPAVVMRTRVPGLSDVDAMGRFPALQAPGLLPAPHIRIYSTPSAHFATSRYVCLISSPDPFQPGQVVAGFPYKFDRVAVLV